MGKALTQNQGLPLPQSGRGQDTRSQRYTPPKYRSYDRDREDYGLIIRKGPRGTTVEVEYHKRHR